MARHIEPTRLLPAYTVLEAAHYLHLPSATLRSWAVGRRYPTRTGARRAHPALKIPATRPPMLSFVNLVEAHVLASITRDYAVPLQNVRRAVRYLSEEFGLEHPLIDQALETDRRDLFVRKAGELVNVSRGGQVAIQEIVELYLSRIEWDETGVAARLYPFTGLATLRAPRSVVIDPHLAFGKPVLSGTNIPTLAIAERFKAGDSLQALAEDYHRAPEDLLEAIRCELAIAA